MCRFLQLAALFYGLACCSTNVAAVEKIPLYSHYTTAPFAVDGVPTQSSCTLRLAAWLSSHSAARYQFEARQIPRLRLNQVVARDDWQGVVTWANPLWFADAERQHFLWSSALMSDRNVLVSRQADGLRLPAQAPSRRLRLGGIAGHSYADLQPLLQRDLLVREDAQSDLSNVFKLQHKRVDLVVLPASSLAYVRAQITDFEQWASISPMPQSSYQRFLFTSRANVPLMDYLQQALVQLGQAPEWAQCLASPAP